jgi:hypothetical protein
MNRRSSARAYALASTVLASTAAITLSSLCLLGCLPQLESTDDDGGASTTTETTVGDAGTGCTQSLTTGVTLCSAIASCPTLVVDQTTFPGCGYRIQDEATQLDLQCNCGSYVCPIGLASSCTAAATLLNGLSYATVCAQAAEGECTTQGSSVVATTPTPTTTSSTTTGSTTTGTSTPTTGTGTSTSSTCNTQCIINCGDAPDCQQLCGC